MNNQIKNNKFTVRTLTTMAIFTALITILTAFVSVAIPGGYGYIHLGDSMIYTCAWALGGPVAGIVSALGSMLADILIGYPQYALATLVIKFLMGYVAYLIMKAFSYKTFTNIIAMCVAAIIMVVGYCSYEYFLSGMGGATAALVPNLIQAAGGVIFGSVVIIVFDNIKAFSPFVTWKVNKKYEQD